MIVPRRFGWVDMLMLLVILAAAAVTRLGYLSVACQQGTNDGPFQVQADRHAEWATLVDQFKEKHLFIAHAPLAAGLEATAHRAIGYPWLLGLLESQWADRESAEQLVRWVQAGLGILTAGLYFLIARRAFQSLVVGTLTGLLTAVHPFWIVNTAEINDGVLATFLLALALWLGVRGGQQGGALTSLLYGLVLAGLACVRAALLPFAGVAVLWFLLRCRRLPRGWLCAVLAFLGFLNGLIPWTARNYQTFKTIIPIADSTYLHLWIGNNPRATGGPLPDDTQREILKDPPDSEGKSRLDRLMAMPQPERYQQLAWDTLREIQANPGDTLARRLRATLGFLVGFDWLSGGSLWRENPAAIQAAPEWLYQLAPTLFFGSLLGMVILGGLGWRWSYAWWIEAIPLALAVVWIPLPYILSHAEALHGPRLPLDGVLLAQAALVLSCVVPRLGAYLWHGTVADGRT
jgi:4-amino-4-deoxy-L-arabinose transferase-like glycosyltransferase